MTDNRTTELLPCPFCGGEYAQVRYMGGEWQEPSAFDSGYRGECCDCGVITAACDTEAEAIEAWNTRSVETCEPDEPDGWYKCPDCGCVVGYWLLNDDSWTIYMDDYQIPFNACPNCGRRVTA